jgi:hypothetical protein
MSLPPSSFTHKRAFCPGLLADRRGMDKEMSLLLLVAEGLNDLRARVKL